MASSQAAVLLVLEGQEDRFNLLIAALPSPLEVLTVQTRLEAKICLIRQPDIAFIGVATRDGNGIFVREFGLQRLDGLII